MLRRLSIFLASVGLVASGLTGVTTSVASAMPEATTWGGTIDVPGLSQVVPSDEQLRGAGLVCSTAGSCTAAGNSDSTIWVAEEVGGIWGSAKLIASNPAIQAPVVDSLACPAQGSCVMVGHYFATSDSPPWSPGSNDGIFTVTQTNGLWGAPQTVPQIWDLGHLDSPQGLGGIYARAKDLSCPSVGNCTAVGSIEVERKGTSWAMRSFTMELVDGTWQVPLGVGSGEPDVQLTKVVCPSVGNCTAVGRGDAISEVGGTWGGLIQIQNPAGNPRAKDLACGSAGNCFVLVNDSSGDAIIQQVDGSWQAPVPPPPLADGSATYPSFVYCATASSCIVVGSTWGSSGASYYSSSYSANGWTTPEPIASSVGSDWDLSSPKDLACSSVDSCVLIGDVFFYDSGPAITALTLTNGSWSGMPKLVPPSGAEGLAWADVMASCPSSNACEALVWWQDDNYGNFVAISGSPPPVGSQVGSPLALTLSDSRPTYGDPVTITATTTPPSLTGRVAVRTSSGRLVGRCLLVSGSCAITTTKLRGGSYDLTATMKPKGAGKLTATSAVEVQLAATAMNTVGTDLTRPSWPSTGMRRGRIHGQLQSGVNACTKNRDVDVVVYDASWNELQTRFTKSKGSGYFWLNTLPLAPGTYNVQVSAGSTSNCGSAFYDYQLVIT